MSLEHLPTNIEEGVQQFAIRQQISRDEAILKLVETGLSVTKSEPEPAKKSGQTQLVAEAVSKIQQVREERAIELATLSTPSESANELIGFLQGDPETVETIRQAIHERRGAMYSG